MPRKKRVTVDEFKQAVMDYVRQNERRELRIREMRDPELIPNWEWYVAQLEVRYEIYTPRKRGK